MRVRLNKRNTFLYNATEDMLVNQTPAPLKRR